MRDWVAEIPEEYRAAVAKRTSGAKWPKPAPRSTVMPSLGNALAVMESFEPTEEYVEPEPPNCARCNDTGWFRRDDWDGNIPPVPPVVECRACDLVGRKRRARFEKLAPVQPPYDSYTFASFPSKSASMTKAAMSIELMSEGVPCNLYLSGRQIGCGKTSLATCLYQAWVTAGTPGMWFVVPKLLDHIRAGFDKESSGYTADQLIEAVYAVPLLMLDDLGAEKMSDWVAEVFYKIVYSRQDAGKSTIFTSNFGLSELFDHLAGKTEGSQIAAERIASRIKGLCGQQVYRVDGPDLR